MSLTKRLLAAVLVLVALTGAAGCGGSSGGSGGGTPIKLSLTDFKISPEEIKVPAGAVSLVISNDGAQPHNIRVVGLKNKVESRLLTPGESQTLNFTVKEKGTFAVECFVAGHKESGMIGKLVTE